MPGGTNPSPAATTEEFIDTNAVELTKPPCHLSQQEQGALRTEDHRNQALPYLTHTRYMPRPAPSAKPMGKNKEVPKK